MIKSMPKIKSVFGREILDSRGNPTVECQLTLETNLSVLSSVPSGASTGTFEAVELRDNDPRRYGGLGVSKAVNNINTIINQAVMGQEVGNQKVIDDILSSLDGTPHKSKLGANAILAVSQAACKAASTSQGMPLYRYIARLVGTQQLQIPIPMFNVINGGAHADNNLQIQEFMIIPTEKIPFKERLRKATEIFHLLKKTLKNRGLNTAIGDEGGFSPNLPSDEDALQLIAESGQINIGLDVAGNKPDTVDYNQLVQKYSIILIEDPFEEDDFPSWQKITVELGSKILIVGDDIFVTNKEKFAEGIEQKIANAILIKSNQIGTVSEVFEVVKIAREHNYQMIASHRSGETEDVFVADLSVGIGASYIKAGAPCRGERVAKYNRLLRIEEELAH